MPTIIFLNGFRFVIWSDDHLPPHVHVFKGEGEAKIKIGDHEHAPVFVTIVGLSKRDAKFAWGVVAENQHKLLDAWEKIHGTLDDQR